MLSLVYMPERKTPFRWPYGIGNVLTLFPSSKQFGLPRPPRGSPPPFFLTSKRLPFQGSWREAPERSQRAAAKRKTPMRSRTARTSPTRRTAEPPPLSGEAHPEQTLHQSIKKRPSNLWKITPIFSCAEAYGVV